MTKIKLCGLRRPCDIEYANELLPEYVGFVFAPESKRYISPQQAEVLSKQLDKKITPVGVFVNEKIDVIVNLAQQNVIQMVQLHGDEDENYIKDLRKLVDCKIIKAFRIFTFQDIIEAVRCSADYVLLDSGGGSGEAFDWSLIQNMDRPYFLAGGLTADNVSGAISNLQPFAIDASSSLETDGYKDKEKMTAFVKAVRQERMTIV